MNFVGRSYKDISLDARLRFLFSHLKGEERLLNIGCGCNGGYVASHTGNYVGLDVDATAKFEGENNVVADAHSLPFRDSSFDSVVMMEVLEHTQSPFHALKEAYRVLESDGLAYITTPNSSYVYYFARNLLGKPAHAEYLKFGHIMELDIRSLKRLFGAVGFKILKLHGSLLPIPPRNLSLRTGFGLKVADVLARHFPLISAGFFMVVAKEVVEDWVKK